MQWIPLVGRLGVVAVSGFTKCLRHIPVIFAYHNIADMTINPSDIAYACVGAVRGAVALGSIVRIDVAASDFLGARIVSCVKPKSVLGAKDAV